MSDTLPPLPEPAQEAQSEGYMTGCPTPLPATPDFYTADQMLAFRAEGIAAALAAAVAAERERCARLCEGMHQEDGPHAYAWAIRAEWAAAVAGTDAELERRTGEPHIDGWPLYSGLPPPQREPYDQTSLGLCNACGWKAVGPDGCLNCAPQREPLTDEHARRICRVGPVYAPDGLVTRTPVEYRQELEAAQMAGVRKAERAHGISAPKEQA